jgi:hypothetical protein
VTAGTEIAHISPLACATRVRNEPAIMFVSSPIASGNNSP